MNNHNTSNAPGESVNLPRIISELEFNNYTQQWLIKINQLTTKLKSTERVAVDDFKDFFLKKDNDLLKDNNALPEQRLLKVYFDCEAVHHIISSVGVKIIKARFAIVDDLLLNGVATPTFTIILYGVDTLGNRCSAYSIGEPQYDYNYLIGKNTPGDISQSISDNLAQRWLKNWKQAEIDTPLFDTTYGYLNGYNYLMADFMNSLYPPGTTRENNGVFVLLAAHDYISYTPGSEHAEVMTFGLVLAGVKMPKSHKNAPGNVEGAVDTFFDLSLPSPPNYQTA
jgi:hypothetical protein